ncbi:MAG TPA: response regulator [Methylomirabilota bacterium]
MLASQASAVCVVDDDASLLRALQLLLRAAGFKVFAFGSAEEFLLAAQAVPPRCLVLDIHLGRLSGFDLHERLTAVGLSIPTIFITAHDDAPTRERARRAGAVAYLRKPFDDKALIASVERALGA